jgi:hypothetical protein
MDFESTLKNPMSRTNQKAITKFQKSKQELEKDKVKIKNISALSSLEFEKYFDLVVENMSRFQSIGTEKIISAFLSYTPRSIRNEDRFHFV